MDKMYYRIICAVCFCAAHGIMYGQTHVYSLDELLKLGRYSTIMQIRESESLINQYENRLFKVQSLPKINLSATLPSLTNSISPIAISDGSEQFVNRFYMSSSISMTISQLIPFTGGTVSLTSGLTRLDNFAPQRTKSFNLNLFSLIYSQSISSFNSYRWNKRLLKANNELFRVSDIQRQEELNLNIIELFFDLYSVQKEIELNHAMVDRAEKLLDKIQILYENGRISELAVLDAQIDLAKMKNTVTSIRREQLQSELVALLNLEFQHPELIFDINSFENISLQFDKDMVISRALRFTHELNRNVEIIQEQRDIKEQKSAGYPLVSLSIGGGINSQAEEFRRLTGLQSNSMSALVSISIPILAWNENRLKVKLLEESAKINSMESAQHNKELQASYAYELDNLSLLVESAMTDKYTLEMLYKKFDQVMANYESGKVDYSDIEETRNQIMQTEIQRIAKIRSFYCTVYRFRIYALYDIIENRAIVN